MKSQIEELELRLKSEQEKINHSMKEIDDIIQSFFNTCKCETKSSNGEYKKKDRAVLVNIGLWFSWDESPIISKHHLYAKLVETCKEWNKRDGFIAKWGDKKPKFCINCEEDKLVIYENYYVRSPLHFKTIYIAEHFLKTFRSELESVKDLI